MAKPRKSRGSRPLTDVLRAELRARGWREYERKGHRVAHEWVHADGEKARSLTDAIVRQLVRELS